MNLRRQFKPDSVNTAGVEARWEALVAGNPQHVTPLLFLYVTIHLHQARSLLRGANTPFPYPTTATRVAWLEPGTPGAALNQNNAGRDAADTSLSSYRLQHRSPVMFRRAMALGSVLDLRA